VLGSLPASIPACIALVQHLPTGFVEPFARFLRTNTALQVALVASRTPPRPGTILIAAEERHLVLSPSGAFLGSDTPLYDGYRPSATLLLRSLAEVLGEAAIGVILSGIGQDGTPGLLEMHARGALTIAQDEASSIVYGMPRAAAEAGAARRILPLGRIAPLLLETVAKRRHL
jgi:chemotaxis response regulator CheB